MPDTVSDYQQDSNLNQSAQETDPETSYKEVEIEIDRERFLPEKPLEELLAGDKEAQTIVVPEKYVDVHEHRLSVKSSIPEEQETYSNHQYRAPEFTLERLFDHYWFPEYGFLVSKDGKVWRHSVLGQFGDPNFLTTYAVEDKHQEDGSINYIFHEHLLHAAPVVEGTHLITSHYASHNYGHFLLDMVPLIHFGTKLKIPLISRPLLKWQKPIYSRIGYEPSSVKQFSERAVFLKDVLVSNRHNAVSTYAASPHIGEVFSDIFRNIPLIAKLRARLRAATRARGKPKRIFLSRGASKNRELANRTELAKALNEKGFSTVRPETLSFDDQALLLSDAELVVSEFGALMCNVVFCSPGTKVIEIIPEDQKDPWSAHLCAALGLEHVTLFHKVSEEDRTPYEIAGRTHSNIFFKYDVDINLVLDVVDQLTTENA